MIDVNDVIEGNFEPETMFEALQASVVVEQLQERVNKGKSNVFGYVLVRARIILAQMHELHLKGGWNNPDVTWYQAAATAFKEEATQAIAAGEVRGFEDKHIKTFKNAVNTLHFAMSENAPLEERDDATGSFVLGGKTAIEKWNKQRRTEQEEARRQVDLDAIRASGANLSAITNADDDAETGSVLDLIKDEEIRRLMEEYIQEVADLEQYSVEQAKVSLNRGIKAVRNNIKNSLESLKKSAAA